MGKKIAQRGKAKDIIQIALADSVNVSYQAASKWGRGDSVPDISSLEDLSLILDLSLEDLLESEHESVIVQKIME